MQITPSVHALKIPFEIPVAPGRSVPRFVYAYIVKGGDGLCLIDTGVATSAVLYEYLQETGWKVEDVILTVLTHAHPDHIGLVREIKGRSGCAVAAHAAERAWIEDTELQARERPVPGFDALVGGAVTVDRVLADGELVALGGGLELEVIHTPGHSPGSISLFFRKEGVLFAGDAVPLAGELPIYEDAVASVRSIERLQKLEGVGVLLGSWDAPQKGEAVYQRMAEGIGYLERLHETVREAAGADAAPEPMELCRRVVALLGLPPVAVNPLVARSFAANLKARDLRSLKRGKTEGGQASSYPRNSPK